eukprot:962705-Rhodomonas_salina.1
MSPPAVALAQYLLAGPDQSRESAVGYWEEIRKAVAFTAHDSCRKDSFRKFENGDEFHQFIARVKAAKATARARKLFWYRGDDRCTCHVAEEIWFEDLTNPFSRDNPLKSFAVVHVHYHGHFENLSDCLAGLLDVDAVNVRHLAAVQSNLVNYSASCPFFDTWTEESGPGTYQVFPAAGDGQRGCLSLKWQRKHDSEPAKQVQALLLAADWAVPWQRGDEKLHRSGREDPEHSSEFSPPCHLRSLSDSDFVFKVSDLRSICRGRKGVEHKKSDGSADEVMAEESGEPALLEYGTEEPDPVAEPIRVLFVGANNRFCPNLKLEEERQGLESAFRSAWRGGAAQGMESRFEHRCFAKAGEL